MARSDDIRDDIRARLEATGYFSQVSTRGTPEEQGFSAGDLVAAVIGMTTDDTTDLFDGGDGTGLRVDERCPVTLMVRNADPQLRDRQLDLVRNVLRRAVNGQSLAGMTVPDRTYVKNSRPMPPKAPERRIEATVVWTYLPESWSDFDDAP